jgi:hypothetical protein
VSRNGAVLGLGLVATLLGCSNQGPAALRGPAEAVVRAAAGRTMAVGGAHVAVSVGAELAGQGAVDLASGAAQLTFARTGTQAHLGDHFAVVTVGNGQWVRPSLTGAWVHGAPRAVTAAVHARVTPLDTLLVRPGLGTDLAFLRGAVKVSPYGGQEVRGVSTFRYSLLVDLAVAIANSPAADRPALQAAADAIGPVVWPADVWLDTSGRVRRLQMAENPFAHTTTTKANLLITQDGNYLALTNIEFFDFGTPVAITPPPADQAVEAT